MHQHVVGPFQLHPLDAELLERARERQPGGERESGRRRGARREAPQQREGEAGALPGQPLPPAPPAPGGLAVGHEHMHTTVVGGRRIDETGVGRVAALHPFEGEVARTRAEITLETLEKIAKSNGGAVDTTRGTPATLAVSTLMWAEAINGYLPPGT